MKKQNNILWLYEYKDLNFKNFIKDIKKDLALYHTYSLLIKFSFNNRTEFRMCGTQLGLIINDNLDIAYLEVLFNTILSRVNDSLDSYNLMPYQDINYIEIECLYQSTLPKIITKKIKNIITQSEYNLNLYGIMAKPMEYNKKGLKNYKYNVIPLTTNNKYYGIPLSVIEIKDILIKIKKNNPDFNKILEKENNILSIEEIFNINNSFYYFKNKIIILISSSENKSIKVIFIKENYKYLNTIYDTNINNNLFSRKIENKEIIIQYSEKNKTNTIISYKIHKTLKPITPLFKNSENLNENIGTFSTETVYTIEGWEKITAIGYHINKEQDSKIYYSKFYNSSEDMIIKCIDNMLDNHKTIFFSHNFGKTDVLFILKTLSEYNIKHSQTYELSPIVKNDHIIFLKIKRLNDKTEIKIIDTNNFFKAEILDLAEAFEIKPEGPLYIKNKLNLLLKIINKFNSIVFKKYNLNITNAITISKLALNIYLKHHNNKTIPSITQPEVYKFINNSYFGGVTEVYKPFGKNLLYLDVNSLYPAASLNTMPGLEMNYIEDLSGNGLNLEELYGFFYAEVETNNTYLGLLPLKGKKGIIYPNGKFKGVWSSIELQYAKSRGYKIKILYGYNFNKVENTFYNFVSHLYSEKQKEDKSLKTVIKSILNNLIGRFGLKIERHITEFMNQKTKNEILKTNEVFHDKLISDNLFLVTYNPNISEEITMQHGLDSIHTRSDSPKHSLKNKNMHIFEDVSIATAAMVTAYARVFMHKAKNSILDQGDKIYYSDTDSLVIENKPHSLNIGKKLGEFKLEHYIKEAHFISNKLYGFINTNDEKYIVAKGVRENAISYDQLKLLYDKNNRIKTHRDEIIKNYNKGTIAYIERNVSLTTNSYTKREKLYEKKSINEKQKEIWIDTKPLNITN